MRIHWPDLAICLTLFLGLSCSASGIDALGPAQLGVEPLALDFSLDKDSHLLLVKNTGGESLTFTVSVSAQSSGIEWLSVTPDSGVVEGGGTIGLLVEAVGRDQLPPGSYEGQVSVTSEGVGAATVAVSIQVGQPVLDLDPADIIDFGTKSDTRTLIIRNSGKGTLDFNLLLPGPWLTQTSVAKTSVGPNAPQTVELTLDRAQVPWYDSDYEILTVVSNGDDQDSTPATIDIEVWVTVDASCGTDDDCEKPGYFCFNTGDGGQCTLRKKLGEECATSAACKSGFCFDEVCCNEQCDGQCLACNLEGSVGTCSALPDGALCDDGALCTEGDNCQAGTCASGDPKDCSGQDSTCSTGYCDEDTGECKADAPENKCAIDSQCIDQGTVHAGKFCLVCDPKRSVETWSVVPGACHIDEECYEAGASVGGGECMKCDPLQPETPSPAKSGDLCATDEDDCTADICKNGVCVHEPLTNQPCNDGNPCTMGDVCIAGDCQGEFFECSEQLECTTGECQEGGGCLYTVVPDFCLIGDVCVAADASKEGAGGCLFCDPIADDSGWTQKVDWATCDDSNACTPLDHCQLGACVGEPKSCDDQQPCTEDSCDPPTGDCTSTLLAEWCLIDDTCVSSGYSPPGKDSQCKICSPSDGTGEWTAIKEGLGCDDGSDCTTSTICSDGSCVSDEELCDDNNECTLDECVDGVICQYNNLGSETACEADLLDCTLDVCKEGLCTHDLDVGFCLIDQACVSAGQLASGEQCRACDPDSNVADWTPVFEGVQCDDGLFCTVEDTCSAGDCVGEPMTCEQTCHDGACDETEDQCKFYPLSDTACDDGNPCTANDICQVGVCGGESKDCSQAAAGNQCQEGVCDPGSQPAPGECIAVDKEVGEMCEDGLFCTTADACDGQGQCMSAEDTDCSGMTDQCNNGFCNEDEDECQAQSVEFGFQCDADGTGCTIGDYCSAGLCIAGELADCSHLSEQCTLGQCDSLGVTGYECQQGLKPAGTPCDDELFCSVEESCDGEGDCGNGAELLCEPSDAACSQPVCGEAEQGCVDLPINNGAICDDSDPCTLDDFCLDGLCTGGDDACGERPLNKQSYHERIFDTGVQQLMAVRSSDQYTAVFWRSKEALWREQLDVELSHRWADGQSTDNSFGGPGDETCYRHQTHFDVTPLADDKWAWVYGHHNAALYYGCNNAHLETKYRVWGRVCPAAEVGCQLDQVTFGFDRAFTYVGVDCDDMCGSIPPTVGSEGPDDKLFAFGFSDGSYGFFEDVDHSFGAPSKLRFHHVFPPDYSYLDAEHIQLEWMDVKEACSLTNDTVLVITGKGAGLQGRLLDIAGSPLGQPFSLSDKDHGHQSGVSCAAIGNGFNIIAFHTCYNSGPCEVYFQAMMNDGAMVGVAQQVNQVTLGNQSTFGPIVVYPDGRFAIPWLDKAPGAEAPAVKVRAFSSGLVPETDAVLLAEDAGDSPLNPVVQALGDGLVLVRAEEQEADRFDLYFTGFDSNFEPVPGPIERRANDNVTGKQDRPVGAPLAEGAFALAWQSESVDAQSTGIATRVFSAEGLPTSAEIRVNEHESGIQQRPDIAATKAGDSYLVVWGSLGQVDMEDVFARFFGPDGQPAGNEFLVNQSTASMQHSPAATFSGEVALVSWVGHNLDDSENDIWIRNFDVDGQALTSELNLSANLNGDAGTPTMSGLQSDMLGAVVAWKSVLPGGQHMLYLAGLDTLGTEVLAVVDVVSEGLVDAPSVSAHDSGGILVTWIDGGNLMGRHYDGTLAPLGVVQQFSADSNPTGGQSVFREGDRVWLVWDHHEGDADGRGIVRKNMAPDGASLSVTIGVNRTESGSQGNPFAMALTNDDVVVGWESDGQDGDGKGIYFIVLD